MKCKKSIMGLAALLIVFFHFYIPFTNHTAELVIYRAAYIGVDLFFFVSVYSLAHREKTAYLSFLGNRFLNVYVPFAVFAAIAGFYQKWQLSRFFKVISGVEFFERGGGSFLWFFVGIMFLYLIAPFLVELKRRLGLKGLALMLSGWLVLALIFQYVLENRNIFILLNRLPVFFAGMYYGEIRKIPLGKFKLPVLVIGLILGGFLIKEYGSLTRLNKPFYDMYYVIAVLFILALVGLWDYVSSRIKIRKSPLGFIGKLTLELYGLQMIFGYDIENMFLKSLGHATAAFFLTALCLIFLAYILYLIKKAIIRLSYILKERKT